MTGRVSVRSRAAAVVGGLRGLALPVAVGVVALSGIQTTLAYWNDTATVDGAGFSSGTLNLQVNGVEGNPVPWTSSQLGLADMVPGESRAASFPVGNAGSVAFTYTATGTASGLLAPYLSFEAVTGGSAATNTTAGGLRTGTCAGGVSMGAVTLGAAAQTLVGTPQQVDPGSTQTLCVKVTLSASAPSSVQGTTSGGTIVLTAVQLGAP